MTIADLNPSLIRRRKSKPFSGLRTTLQPASGLQGKDYAKKVDSSPATTCTSG